MEYDLAVYLKSAVVGVPLLFIVNGLVWVWGKLGASGKIQLLSSMATGLVLGVGFMISQTKPPVGGWWEVYVYWFANAIYGIGLGLLASGFYEGAKAIIAKLVKPLPEKPV